MGRRELNSKAFEPCPVDSDWLGVTYSLVLALDPDCVTDECNDQDQCICVNG